VHGPAFAGGTGLVAACDIAVGTGEAKVLLLGSEARPLASDHQPARAAAIGERAARRYFLTAEVFDAEEAHRIGMLSLLVSPSEIDSEIEKLLTHLLAGGPEAMRKIKELVRAVASRPLDDALVAETAKRIAEIRVSPEGKEGNRQLPRKSASRPGVQENPDRQPRRDRLPRGAHCPAHGHPQRRGLRDADHASLHVKTADESQRIASYLDIDSILAAARACGAEAIHPGYGFLAENEDFASACATAGVVFIGPTPEAIAAMGDKSAAKRLMEKAKVPLVPAITARSRTLRFWRKRRSASGSLC